ncbi:MAG TPA: 4-alpha-glucanotransferase [Ktedonobacterales bacterium]|jgi:4-alpha-glucanotransferase
MQIERTSGILLHPTSLPGPFGIGELGEEAYHFLDFLADSKQHLWQVLPLGPTGYADSPYASFSSFAGNHLLISLRQLAKDGLLEEQALQKTPAFPSTSAEYGTVIAFKMPLLWQSFETFRAHATPEQQKSYDQFRLNNQRWLDDYALFMALKDEYHGAPWTQWASDIAARKPEALFAWQERLAPRIAFHTYLQYQFSTQWANLKRSANARGIQIVGDLPIFVAHDSTDVWAHPELFYLDEAGAPTVISGVPPDYFSVTGQRWGNPLYRWDRLAATGYAWWIDRFRAALGLVDLLRLDHFRGFQAYWEIPGDEETAINGRWVPGPGAELFNALQEALGEVPVIAEDLGVITPDVVALRTQFGFPSMRVLQFGFSSDARNEHLAHNFERQTLVYTGTHDNDTTVGWYQTRSPLEQNTVREYLATDGSNVSLDLIRLAFSSVAELAIVPLQDVLALGSEARMNMPGRAAGNWAWRYQADMLKDWQSDWLAHITRMYNRIPPTEPMHAEPTPGEGA